jgi:hypothetical protein
VGKKKGEGKRRKGKGEGSVSSVEKYVIYRGECERRRR